MMHAKVSGSIFKNFRGKLKKFPNSAERNQLNISTSFNQEKIYPQKSRTTRANSAGYTSSAI